MDKKDIRPGIVYRNRNSEYLGVLFLGYDYDCLSEDEVGIVYKGNDQHPSSPAFVGTDPKDLEKATLKPEEILTESHIKKICKINCGEDCCRYLIADSEGFSCAGVSGDTVADVIDGRVKEKSMIARAINCGGRYQY